MSDKAKQAIHALPNNVAPRPQVVRSLVIGGRDLFGMAFSFLSCVGRGKQVLEKCLGWRATKQR